MDEKEIMSQKFIRVDMNDAQISTDEKPIIGTYGLSTCVGVLLYSEKNKRAIVAHISDMSIDLVYKTMDLIIENQLYNAPIKYKIIPGFYPNNYNLYENINNIYSENKNLFVPFDEIDDKGYQISFGLPSHEFAFDASTGKFVTNKVYFDYRYDIINNKKSL